MENKKILTERGKLSCNSVTLALFLSFGIASNALALECSEGAIACGDDCAAEGATCKWEISSTGQLTISGDGAMKENFNNRTISANTDSDDKITTAASYGDYWDKITSIKVEEGITSTGGRAFQGLSQVTSITLPKSLDTINERSFDRMAKLETVNIPSDGKLQNLGGSIFYMDKAIGNETAQNFINTIAANGVTSIPNGLFDAFYASTGSITSIEIPDTITSIGGNAFSDHKLTSLEIPSTVTSIGSKAFEHNDLVSLTLPEGITNIGTYAFQGNDLKSVDLPASLTTIPNGIFQNNKLESIDIPDTVTKIGDNAFKGNKLSGALIIPDSVTEIGRYAFQNNSITTLYVPDSVTTIGAAAFSTNTGVKIKDLVISDDVDTTNWEKRTLTYLDANATIHCQGDIDKCTTALAKFIPADKGGTCTTTALCLKGDFKIVEAKDGYCTGKCNGTSCQLANYYFDGVNCIKEPDASKRTCDYETSGYIKMGNYCASPETTYAKKHYTPAEALQWLKENDNTITLTFKK